MFRTPSKNPTTSSPPTTPPKVRIMTTITKTQTNVRRSIGEWEAGKILFPDDGVAAPQHNIDATSVQTANKTLPGASKTQASLTARAERVKEARACVTKAKVALNASRNLKTDIKADVTQAIDRLYQLVKEDEAQKPAPPSVPKTTCVDIEGDAGDLRRSVEEEQGKELGKEGKRLFRDLPTDDDRIEIRFRKRARNDLLSHIVARVSPILWTRLLEASEVYIDLQHIRVEDQSPLVQCSMCLGYGHSRRLCTETTEKCGHCGGPHLRKDCAQKLANAAPTCCNCVTAKLEMTGHNAFSTDCPVRRRWDALARAKVAYC